MDNSEVLSRVLAAVGARFAADPKGEFTAAQLREEIASATGSDPSEDQVFDALNSIWGSGIEPKTTGRHGLWGVGWSKPPVSREIRG